jgi:hypothetical protein
MSKISLRRAALAVATVVLLACSGAADAAEQTSQQRKCATLLLKDGQKLATANASATSACLKEASKGTVTDIAGCIADTTPKKVSKAASKGKDHALASCSLTPAEFGIPASFYVTINEAATFHGDGLALDLLGDAPVATTDKTQAKCQQSVYKGLSKLADAQLAGFGSCVGDILKGGAETPGELDACLSTMVTSKKVNSAAAKLADAVTGQCQGVDTDALFPGVCVGTSGSAFVDCMATRARCRACRQAATSAALDGGCDLVDDGVANDSCVFRVSISGDAIPFTNGPDGRVEGATITVLEHPEMNLVTGADGHFQFDDLLEGEEITLTLQHPDYHDIQTGTHRLGPYGAERVTFQAVTYGIYDLFGAILDVVPDDANKCQIVTTVTRHGKSVYDTGAHGEAEATVDLSPSLPSEHGPIYFNEAVVPAPERGNTSVDGGVLYIQVPPGEYVWTANKPFKILSRVKSKCRVGWLVNASPPWGLQVLP